MLRALPPRLSPSPCRNQKNMPMSCQSTYKSPYPAPSYSPILNISFSSGFVIFKCAEELVNIEICVPPFSSPSSSPFYHPRLLFHDYPLGRDLPSGSQITPRQRHKLARKPSLVRPHSPHPTRSMPAPEIPLLHYRAATAGTCLMLLQ